MVLTLVYQFANIMVGRAKDPNKSNTTNQQKRGNEMNRVEINAKFKELAEWKMIEAEAKANREAIEAELKAYMTEAELTELIGDEHKATYKEEIRNTFDSKAFKAAGHADLYEAFRKPSATRKFIFA